MGLIGGVLTGHVNLGDSSFLGVLPSVVSNSSAICNLKHQLSLGNAAAHPPAVLGFPRLLEKPVSGSSYSFKEVA